jgi:hypothetical protein
MSSKTFTYFLNLPYDHHQKLPQAGFIQKSAFKDTKGSEINILTISNGLLSFTVLIERGLDVGEIYLGGEKITWERSTNYLLHPDNVILHQNSGTGWLNGFYPAVASIGPELFGTPGEGYTLHGSGSYSPADARSVTISCDDEEITVDGIVNVKDHNMNIQFEKRISIKTHFNSTFILREETTKNMSDLARVVDDALHIQLAGNYMNQGGAYVLPVKRHSMLIRDSAPAETDPLVIYPLSDGKQPIRCYQYIPEPVSGLDEISELKPVLPFLESKTGITAEMIINCEKDTAAYVVRPLDCFPRSLIAKEVDENTMYSFEPCRTRPNRMSQKITDGEAFFLRSHAVSKTQCIIGITKDTKTITILEKLIRKAAGE